MSQDLRALFKRLEETGFNINSAVDWLFRSHFIKGARGVKNGDSHASGVHFHL